MHWWVISFTVGFGADRSDGDESPIEWGEFKSLLPSLDNVCKITAVAGLTGSLSPGASGTALKSDSEDAAGSGEGDMAVPPVQTSQPSQSSEPSQLHEAFLPSQPYELSQPSQPSQTSELSDPAGPSPSGPGPDIWLVRAGSFSFTTQTAIPASHFTAGQATNPVTDPKYPEAYPVHIRTMNKRTSRPSIT